MQTDNIDNIFKIIIVGDTHVGKSSIVNRFINDKFQHSSTHTIGVCFDSTVVNVQNKYIRLQLWDTAGQERFRSITRTYYKGAVGAVLTFDITNRLSFNHVISWLNDVKEFSISGIPIILVGNKSDKNTERQVYYEEANKFAHDNQIKYIETSALSGDNIFDLFIKLTKIILANNVGNEFTIPNINNIKNVKNIQTPNTCMC